MLCKPVCVCSPEFRYYPRAVLISIDRPISRVHRLRKPLLLPRFMAFSSLFLSQFVFEAQAGGRGGFFGLIVLARIPLRERVRRIARRGWRERVDEFVLLYGYISFSYVRPLDRSGTLLLRLYLSLRLGISALLDILYIYIYIYTCEFLRTRVSVIYSRHGSICIGLAKCVGWVRGELVGMTVPREANTIAARNSRSVNRDEKDNKDREGGWGARTSR